MRLVLVALLLAATATADARGNKRVAAGDRATAVKPPKLRGQSIGSPWDGRLHKATRLKSTDGVHLRRPQRAFGTRTTVDHLRRAIEDTHAQFPRTHRLAIGDLSSRDGGWLSEHQSHQSGRDADLGLFYVKRPPGYPASFVRAWEDTLDAPVMWALISNLVSTARRDGGVQLIFLDYDLQGIIYDWAIENGVSRRRLSRVFQYPYGPETPTGVVRHEPNHEDHLHVRFRCAAADVQCR